MNGIKDKVRDQLTVTYRNYNPSTGFETHYDLIRQQVVTLLDGGGVNRFHTVRTLTPNSISEHSHGVAYFCDMIAGDRMTVSLFRAAICHDLAEYKTGDMPSFSKRIMEVREKFSAVEDGILESVGLQFELNALEHVILKLADCADGMLFCIREMQLGSRNQHTLLAYKNYGAYVNTALENLPTLSPPKFHNRALIVFKVLASMKKEALKHEH